MIIKTGDLQLELREATPDDVPLILSFIRSLADFENLKVETNEEQLKNTLFGEKPVAYTLLAFDGDTPVAYIIYFYTFSTILGKPGLWLEDLYVKPEYRKHGIGRAMLAHMAKLAVEKGCGRFEWAVLDWNTNAINLYTGFGARMMKEWIICRMEGEKLKDLATR